MDFLQRARASLVEAFEKGVEGCMGDEVPTRAELRAQLRALEEKQQQLQFASDCTELYELALEYSWEEVVNATDNFSAERRLGSGANGTVFKGTLEEGIDVAVKVIEAPVGGGFEEEVRLLSRCRHPNVVMLLGFAQEPEPGFLEAWAHKESLDAASGGQACLNQGIHAGNRVQATVDIHYELAGTVHAGGQGSVIALAPSELNLPEGTMIICWDGLPNLHNAIVDKNHVFVLKSLRRALVYELLSAGDVNARLMSQKNYFWHERLRTTVDIARGLAHLHKHRPEVFHRDIKTANVLFGLDGTAKIADFGLACVSKLRGARELAVESTPGTPGYVDPLYSENGVVTEANEVYSFGMVLFELITGRPPAVVAQDGHSIIFLHEQFRPHEEGAQQRILEHVDVRAMWPPSIASSLVTFALLCIHKDTDLRPSFVDVATTLHDLASSTSEPMETNQTTDMHEQNDHPDTKVELEQTHKNIDVELEQTNKAIGVELEPTNKNNDVQLETTKKNNDVQLEQTKKKIEEIKVEPKKTVRYVTISMGSPQLDRAAGQDHQVAQVHTTIRREPPLVQPHKLVGTSAPPAASMPSPSFRTTSWETKKNDQLHRVTILPPNPGHRVVHPPVFVAAPVQNNVAHVIGSVGPHGTNPSGFSGIKAPIKVVSFQAAPAMNPIPVRILP